MHSNEIVAYEIGPPRADVYIPTWDAGLDIPEASCLHAGSTSSLSVPSC